MKKKLLTLGLVLSMFLSNATSLINVNAEDTESKEELELLETVESDYNDTESSEIEEEVETVEIGSAAVLFEDLDESESKLNASDFYFDFEESGKGEEPVEEESKPSLFRSAPVTTQALLKSVEPGFGVVNEVSMAIYYLYDNADSTRSTTYVSAEGKYTYDFPVLEAKNNRFRIVISGFEGWIDQSAVRYIPNDKNLKESSHYYVDSYGDLVHRLMLNPSSSSSGYGNIHNGQTPNYLTRGTDYYSYDGHYFYKDRTKMLNDYKNKTRSGSLNPNNPFYNYFQFLSYRSKTNHTAKDIDGRLASAGYGSAGSSLLHGQSNNFIDQQKEYGNNAMLTFSTSVTESAWGTSEISSGSNNIFSHAAYDSNPGNGNKYPTVADAIRAHNGVFLNGKYLNYQAADNLYDGSMLGNKESGIGLNYASDPYWGEKIAASYYTQEDKFGKKDFEKEIIGYTTGKQKVNLRKEPNTNSAVVSQFHLKNQSFIVLGKVEGEKIDGSNIWYKIVSDHLLDKNNNRLVYNSKEALKIKYNHENNAVYVHSGAVGIAGRIDDDVSIPIPPNPEPPKPTYKKGDIDGNGKVEMWDSILIYKYVVGTGKLSAEEKKRADVDSNGKVEMWDSILVYKYVVGTGTLR